MSFPAAIRLLAALPLVALLFACSDDSDASASARKPVVAAFSANADLPLGTGFDFYVLALSWSPAYCLIEGARANRNQCAEDRDLGFVVHGLWPQFEDGYPQYCGSREPERVPSQLGQAYLDLLPSMGLIGQQWRKHGSCSGLSQKDYLEVLRAARQRINVPSAFALDKLPGKIDAFDAENAFIAANPGMQRDGVAVTCDRRMLREIRICMTGSLEFRGCAKVDRAGCTIDNLSVPEPN
ncbi:ribonuclease T2 family protein [Hoeflea sp. Naph1]|uniref:ribonuclease T2 family protein n=1 Tax=Hoeflea sp. Naph1 TaxID=3388653 RepID=UPI00398FC908